jgi:hypothetical protein
MITYALASAGDYYYERILQLNILRVGRTETSPDRWIERKVSDPISLILPRFLPLLPLGGGLYSRAISFEIPSEKLQVETEDIYKDPR